MPPRKSNVSAVSTGNEDGTPTKEPKDGVNIEVNPLSHLPQGPSVQLENPTSTECLPLHSRKTLPARTAASYGPYVMGASGVFPHSLSPNSAPSQLAFVGNGGGFLSQREMNAASSHANAPALLSPGAPGSPWSSGLIPFNHLQEPHTTPGLIHGPSSSIANGWNSRADLRFLAQLQDLSLPKTMVQRLAKGVLPANTQIQKDAILAMQKGATVFVNYLAQAANATAQTNNRRTIPPPAIFDALQELEFDFMSDWVSQELIKFNDTNAGKRNEYRRKLKEEEKQKKDQEGGPRADSEAGEGDDERAAKRARMGDDEEDEEEGREGGTGMNGLANGNESTMNGHDGGDEDDPIDLDENDEENENENEDGGQEEPDEEDEEDDEDAFPDEGRRLSSVEAETYTDGEARAKPVSEDEAMDDDESD